MTGRSPNDSEAKWQGEALNDARSAYDSEAQMTGRSPNDRAKPEWQGEAFKEIPSSSLLFTLSKQEEKILCFFVTLRKR